MKKLKQNKHTQIFINPQLLECNMKKKEEQIKEVKPENSEQKLKYNIKEYRCIICNSRNTYTNKDSRICRKCGHKEKIKEELKSKKVT